MSLKGNREVVLISYQGQLPILNIPCASSVFSGVSEDSGNVDLYYWLSLSRYLLLVTLRIKFVSIRRPVLLTNFIVDLQWPKLKLHSTVLINLCHCLSYSFSFPCFSSFLFLLCFSFFLNHRLVPLSSTPIHLILLISQSSICTIELNHLSPLLN